MTKAHLWSMALAIASVANAPAQPQRVFEPKALAPGFWDLLARDARLETVAGDFKFTEGPVWHQSGFLYVSDEELNKVFRLFPDGRRETALDIGDPDGATFDAKHRLVVCADTLRAVVEMLPDGKYRVLADRYDGKRFNSPNDVVLGPDGALYFTDPTLDLPKGERQEIPFQGVYRLSEDGTVRLLTRDLEQPNGLAFSPDGRRLYVDDSSRKEIRVYDVGADGSLDNDRLFAKEDGPPRSGVPDGMRIDIHGNVFATGPLGIWVWSADGSHLGTIVLPSQPANLAWGDADLGTLYITARGSVYRLKTKTRGFVPSITATPVSQR